MGTGWIQRKLVTTSSVATELDRFLDVLLSTGLSLLFVALPLEGLCWLNQAERLPAISRSSSA